MSDTNGVRHRERNAGLPNQSRDADSRSNGFAGPIVFVECLKEADTMTMLAFVLHVMLSGAAVTRPAPTPIAYTVSGSTAPVVSARIVLTTPDVSEPLDELLATYRLSRRAL